LTGFWVGWAADDGGGVFGTNPYTPPPSSRKGSFLDSAEKTYEQVKVKAARQAHEWIRAYPEHFRKKAKEIYDLHVEAEKDYKRLNPPLKEIPLGSWKETPSKKFDPTLFVVAFGGNMITPIKGKREIPPSDPEKRRLIHYAALLLLHESYDCWPNFTDGIWPKDNPLSIFARPGDPFKENWWKDKSDFLEDALEEVENDLKTFHAPLPNKARFIYEKLRSLEDHQALTLPEIQKLYNEEFQKELDEGTWKKFRKLLLPLGLKNKPRVGYFIKK